MTSRRAATSRRTSAAPPSPLSARPALGSTRGASGWTRQGPRPAAAAPAARAAAGPRAPYLTVAGLTARYGQSVATRDVTIEIGRGECVALVGESGSGKTTIARSIAGLHSEYEGTVSVDGRRLAPSVTRRPAADRRLIQYVFQNPYASLNPRRSVAGSVALAAGTVLGIGRADAQAAAARMIELVGLRPDQLAALPRDLSGGERQRVALARALVCEPDVLVCDEVTSSLDVSVQAGIVTLLRRLRAERGLTMLFITHDLALAASISDAAVVLRGGLVVEDGPTGEVLSNPRDPYTQSLVAASA